MKTPAFTLIGLGPGSPDALTVGALRALRRAADAGRPIWLRTRIHPTVPHLEAEEKVAFAGSFDEFYERGETFESVYERIADRVIALARECGALTFAVPGHPLFGERSVALLIERCASEGIGIEIAPAVSFLDTVLEAARLEAGAFKLVDAAALPEFGARYRVFPSPFDPAVVNVVYQVYDRQVASSAKLALLGIYPPDFAIGIARADSATGSTSVANVALSELDWPAHDYDHLTSLIVAPLPDAARRPDFTTLLDIMARLRDPQTGCPWDREQTPEKLKRYLIEESHEVLEAIDGGDPDKYAEELGDLLLQVAFHSQLAREEDLFDAGDVVRHIVDKLIRRHPHVFGDLAVSGADEVLVNWEAIKRSEKGYEDRKSILDGVAGSLPALMKAQEISKRAARAGFEWESIDGVFDKLDEEIAELREARATGTREQIADEIGDMLFTVVNLARFEKVDAEEALRRMVARFTQRFRKIEDAARRRGIALETMTQPEMEEAWRQAKQES